MSEDIRQIVIDAAQELNLALKPLEFTDPVSHVYLPTEYAWDRHREYLARFACTKKRVLLMGMNPGPWGMAQTGVPFGEIPSVRDWMGIGPPRTGSIELITSRCIAGTVYAPGYPPWA